MMKNVAAFNGHMSPPIWNTYFDHGLGKHIGSKREKREAIRRYNEEHQTELEELGNDRWKGKPAKREYDWNQINKEFREIRGH